MENRSGKFSSEIAAALQKASVEKGVHVKTVAAWTGANERTVKNWFSGQYGPSGEHLVVLARHSDDVLRAILAIMDREDLLMAQEIVEIEKRINRLSKLLDEVKLKNK